MLKITDKVPEKLLSASLKRTSTLENQRSHHNKRRKLAIGTGSARDKIIYNALTIVLKRLKDSNKP